MKLRVGMCQILTGPEVRKSTDKILLWMKKAAQAGVDVAVFPEASTCGWPKEAAYFRKADPADFLSAEKRIIRAAKRLDIAAVVGTARWGKSGVHNSLLVVDKGGIFRGYYDKIHQAEPWSVPGDRLPVFTVSGAKSCFLICFDQRFPELLRLPVIAGAKICYCSSYHSDPSHEHKASAYEGLPIARATENSIFYVAVAPPANPGNLAAGSNGESRVVDPDGVVLVRGSMFKEELVLADIDMSKATRNIARRAIGDNTVLKPWLEAGLKLVGETSE